MAIIQLQDGRKINFEGTPTQTDIDEAVASLGVKAPRETQSKSFFRPRELVRSIVGGIREEVGAAAQDIQEARERQARGEQGILRTSITTVAQGAQAGLGAAFRGVLDIASAIIPDFIEDPIRRKLGEGFEEFIASETGERVISGIKKATEKIDALDPKNQQLVRDIIDVGFTGVDIASFGIGGKAARRGLAQVGVRAGERGRGLVTRAEEDVARKVQEGLADLVIDTSTPTRRAQIATRTKEGGFFSGRTVTPTARELLIAEELIQTPNINVRRSALFNLNSLTKEVAKEADKLKTSLKENNFIFPRKEANARLTSALNELKKTDTDVIGEAERLADRIFDRMKVFINDSDGTGLGGLTARQRFDKWVLTKKPKAFEKQDAFNTIVRSARNTVNDFVAEKATKTDVKSALQRQSRLLSAQDILKVKAGKESAVGFMRLLDRATEALGTKNRIVQLVATAVGIGGLGAAATFAPAVAAVGGLVGAVALLIKALKSPASRKKLGQVLIAIEKVLPTVNANEKAILVELKEEIKALLGVDSSIEIKG